MSGHGVMAGGLPAVGTVMDCGCTVRLLSTSGCPRCGAPPFGERVARFPVSALPGTVAEFEVGCWHCGHEYSTRARVLA